MIPLQLTIQGLYSYQEPQTIDFEQLTASQLFGIFGAVGSGKSSVLEAIVFALYDRSERLNSKGDDRYYNMLNLQSQCLAIDFVFQAAVPHPTKYRFTVTAQRKKKNYEKVEVKERAYYRWEDDAWRPFRMTDPATIVGMTYDNFMQTVIIPQGKFREFIDRRPADRTQMLKELFRLEKFDLSFKTNQLLGQVRSTVTDLEARLSEIGPVSEEEIDATRREVYELEVALRQKDDLLRTADERCRGYELLKKLFAERATAERQLWELESQQSDYQAKEQQLRAFREAELYFNDRFERLAATISDRNIIAKRHRQLQDSIRHSEQQLGAAKTAWETARRDYDGRETIRAQCGDLETLLRINQANGQQTSLQAEEQRARKAYTHAEQQVANSKQRLKLLEEQLSTSEQNLERQTTLREVARWHRQQAEYQIEHEQQQHRIAAQQATQQTIEQRKAELLAAYQWHENGDFNHFFRQLEKKTNVLKQKIQRAASRLGELLARASLVEQAQRLLPGEACPLCGSTHHPAIAPPASPSEIANAKKDIAQLRQQEEREEELEKAMRRLQNEQQVVRGKLESLLNQQRTAEERVRHHAEAFVWEDYRTQDAAAVSEQVRQVDQQQAEQKTRREQRAHEQQQLERAERQLREAQQHWQQAQDQRRAQQSRAEGYREQLRVLTGERFLQRTEAQLHTRLAKEQARLAQAEEQYEATRQEYQRCETELGIGRARHEEQAAHLAKLQQQATTLEQEILELCREKEFEDVAHVQSLIDLKLDKDTEQEEITAYKNRLHTARNEVVRLEQETQNQHYDPHRHQEADATCLRLRQAIKETHESWGRAVQAIKDQQQRREKTRELNQKLKQQQQREDQLKTLSSLFRGSGFVNYASSVLLRDVCRAANVRFKQLTQNNLSLDLNDKNDFIVRDYLNEGRTRLLKTLSGGQTFQAALCLALALAENIKSLNQAQQSFFFLDEGFGALDKASLRVVFDTLKSLRKENRIVGIISHVEELQQEIDVYLKIENDKERGSLVRNSWE